MQADIIKNEIEIEASNEKNRTINIDKNAQIVELIDKQKVKSQKTKIKIAPNTQADYIFLLDKKFKNNFIEERIVEVGENAQASFWYCYLGGEVNNINLHYKIAATAQVKHKTIFLAKNNQQFRFNDTYEFAAPNAKGSFDIRGILKNNAKASALANIQVNKQASKIKSNLNLKLYILGNKAQGEMLPGLDINNDDVVAGHSASVSHISQDDLFLYAITWVIS